MHGINLTLWHITQAYLADPVQYFLEGFVAYLSMKRMSQLRLFEIEKKYILESIRKALANLIQAWDWTFFKKPETFLHHRLAYGGIWVGARFGDNFVYLRIISHKCLLKGIEFNDYYPVNKPATYNLDGILVLLCYQIAKEMDKPLYYRSVKFWKSEQY